MQPAIIFGMQIGLIAFVYSVLLVEPGHVLRPVKEFLYKYLTIRHKVPLTSPFGDRTSAVEEISTYKIVEQETWLYKMLIGCERCVAGQMGLWCYIIAGQKLAFSFSYMLCVMLSAAASILICELLKKIYERFK